MANVEKIKYAVKKSLFYIIIFALIFVFDVVVFIRVNEYYSKPFITGKNIRINAYTLSLACNGFILVDGKYYYCDDKTEIVKDQIVEWKNNSYYLDPSGILVTNEVSYKIGNSYYNIDENGVMTIIE